MSAQIFWVDNTQIYDCRTHSLIRPNNFDCIQVLESLKESGFEGDELFRKLKKIALLLMVLKRDGIQQVLSNMVQKPGQRLENQEQFKQVQRYTILLNSEKFKSTLSVMDTDTVMMILQLYLQDDTKKKIEFFNQLLGIEQTNVLDSLTVSEICQQQIVMGLMPNASINEVYSKIVLMVPEYRQLQTCHEENKVTQSHICTFKRKDTLIVQSTQGSQGRAELSNKIQLIQKFAPIIFEKFKQSWAKEEKFKGLISPADEQEILQSTPSFTQQPEIEENKKPKSFQQLFNKNKQAKVQPKQQILIDLEDEGKDVGELEKQSHKLLMEIEKPVETPPTVVEHEPGQQQPQTPIQPNESKPPIEEKQILDSSQLSFKPYWMTDEIDPPPQTVPSFEDLREQYNNQQEVTIVNEPHEEHRDKNSNSTIQDQQVSDLDKQGVPPQKKPPEELVQDLFNELGMSMPQPQNLEMPIFLEREPEVETFLEAEYSIDSLSQVPQQEQQLEPSSQQQNEVLIDEEQTLKEKEKRLVQFYSNPYHKDVKPQDIDPSLAYLSTNERMVGRLVLIPRNDNLDIPIFQLLSDKNQTYLDDEIMEEHMKSIANIFKTFFEDRFKTCIVVERFQGDSGETFYKALLEVRSQDKVMDQKIEIGASLREVNILIRIHLILIISSKVFSAVPNTDTTLFEIVYHLINVIQPRRYNYLTEQYFQRKQKERQQKAAEAQRIAQQAEEKRKKVQEDTRLKEQEEKKKKEKEHQQKEQRSKDKQKQQQKSSKEKQKKDNKSKQHHQNKNDNVEKRGNEINSKSHSVPYNPQQPKSILKDIALQNNKKITDYFSDLEGEEEGQYISKKQKPQPENWPHTPKHDRKNEYKKNKSKQHHQQNAHQYQQNNRNNHYRNNNDWQGAYQMPQYPPPYMAPPPPWSQQPPYPYSPFQQYNQPAAYIPQPPPPPVPNSKHGNDKLMELMGLVLTKLDKKRKKKDYDSSSGSSSGDNFQQKILEKLQKKQKK